MHKHRPVSAERSLMKGLTVLQRSRSLRDPSMSPSLWNSPSAEKLEKYTALNRRQRSLNIERLREVRRLMGSSLPVANRATSKVASTEAIRKKYDRAGSNEGGETRKNHKSSRSGDRKKPSQYGRDWGVVDELGSRKREGKEKMISHEGNHSQNRKTLSEQFKEFSADSEDVESSRFHRHGYLNELNKVKRHKFGGTRRARVSVDSRDLRANNELSIASNSLVQGSAFPNCYIKGAAEEYDRDKPEASWAPRNRCRVPWNWLRIHHRGKTCMDMAGRSLSCGFSNSRLKIAKDHVPRGKRGVLDMPVMSDCSSSYLMPDSEELPLLTQKAGSLEQMAFPAHDYSGELDIFSDNNLRHNRDSDLDSEASSANQCNYGEHCHGRHQSLTQKYMPRTFKDLMGQNLVIQALSNAILRRKIGFLYVFYGPRGTGKTSCARIFARALNCQSLDHPKPCGICDSCIARDLGKSQNVQEVNPVHNFDFESIMGLLESMITSKLRSQYRVLIVDDCDTLPLDSWSAISKVIDLAPRWVVFVLVSTSLDRLPHAIISRCQKFFFQKLRDRDIIYTLQRVAKKEHLEIGKDALKLIASRSGGSLMDALMTLDQLSLLGWSISPPLVQELVGLISDDKLVDLLDSALSADTVTTIKNIREIMEAGVEPLELMSQLATIITNILAGSYIFTTETVQRRFFCRPILSKKHMEKLRQALKRLSKAEKQLRASSDRLTWLTAALLQLAPDQQYILPSSSADINFNHSPIAPNNTSKRHVHRKCSGEVAEMPNYGRGLSTSIGTGNLNSASGNDGLTNSNLVGKKKNVGIPGKSDNEVDEVWLAVLEKIRLISLRRFMHQEGKLISVSFGAVPNMQLMFSSHVNKCEAEKYSEHILQAFKSVLGSSVTIEIRCEARKDVKEEVQVPFVLPTSENGSARMSRMSESLANNKKFETRLANRTKRLSKDRLGNGVGSTKARHLHSDSPEISKSEIVEIGSSTKQHECSEHVDDIAQLEEKCSRSVLTAAAAASHHQFNSSPLPERQKVGEQPQIRSLVRRRVTLAQLIQQAGGFTQRNGLIIQKAVSIAKKLEKENLKLEPRSRSLCCWKASRIPGGKLPYLRIRTRKPHSLLKLVPCARCLCGKYLRRRMDPFVAAAG
ncbi:protein STICHEL-like 4 isoform X3 [Magnolia sinica]|uniref:protein STICHEL-like 4 isoform X3 n=1 Tax=Magnolia sinica TaxID=86752 RepID=UPI002658BA47|nr:protein STICHEL-like 4 isoform X3 [Magnolia sinica]